MSFGDGVVSARLRGAWTDRSLDYDAQVRLDADTLRISYDPGPAIELPVQDLRGTTLHDGALTLHAKSITVSLSDSPHLDGLRNRIEAAVCVFPAQTLSLRGFGSERSAPGSDVAAQHESSAR